jgi:outer membrane protein OmpA-like peptidoglycan-associated protein
MAKLKAAPKAILIAAAVGILGYGAHIAMNAGYFKPKATIEASVPDKIDLPTAAAATPAATTTIAATTVSSSDTIRIKTIPWNGTAGLHFANGDATTASGSLMAKRGLKVNIKREDDYAKLIADLATFAKDNSQGSHFVIIMGDGYPAFVKGANDALAPFNQSVAVVGALGYSRGEDKCIIDKNATAKGSLIAGYLGDGDINICIKYAADNGIVVNSDPKTYDPNGMNFAGTGSFTEADEKFMAGACETRTNTATKQSQKVCVNGSATWTPGDVKLARERGNLKVLASTKEYAWQMPTTIIGNKQWMQKNPEVVKALLAAAFEGGEAVRSNSDALLKSGAVQAKVYGEQDAAYWAKYHRGVVENDKTGNPIFLGGSTTNGLADNAFLFGLNGNDNLYKKVYTVYGNIAVKYFPDMLDKLIPYEDVVDTTYVQALLAGSTTVAPAAVPTYGGQKAEVVANKSYTVEFDSGKSTIKPASIAVLNDLLDNIAVSSLSVQINGHTDSKGNPTSNMILSKARAEAVKQFLMTNAGSNFPTERIVTRGYGDTQPIGSDAQNRRVEIVLFSTK